MEPGLRWIKHPATITLVWLDKPERIAALAMLTVVGWLVYALIPRQGRLYLQSQQQFLPGNKGMTATPTAAGVLSLFAPVAMVQLVVENRETAMPLCYPATSIGTLWSEVHGDGHAPIWSSSRQSDPPIDGHGTRSAVFLSVQMSSGTLPRSKSQAMCLQHASSRTLFNSKVRVALIVDLPPPIDPIADQDGGFGGRVLRDRLGKGGRAWRRFI